jgi:ubiquinone/menaquinone biosynthesis C-methylase UbiE
MPPDGFGDSTLYGRSFADVYDEWYPDVSDAEATVAVIASFAGEGTVLELGAGTGRLALPLGARGPHVIALDVSTPMLQRLLAKQRREPVAPLGADMAALPLRHASITVAFVAFNTLFNLDGRAAMQACLDEVGRVLVDDGRLVIEAFVPPEPGEAQDSGISVRSIAIDKVVLTVAQRDHTSQTITGQHVEISEGAGVRLRPWRVSYATPSQIDEMAAAAGFVLERRSSGWNGEPFDGHSHLHVSVFRRAAPSVSRADCA